MLVTLGLFQTDRHLGTDSGMAVDVLIKGLARDTERFGPIGHAEASGSRQAFLTIRPGWAGFFIGFGGSPLTGHMSLKPAQAEFPGRRLRPPFAKC